MVGPHIDEIIEKIGNKNEVKQVINGYLLPNKYVKSGEGLHYKITDLGKNHLLKQRTEPTISFGDNTNFAYNSPHAQQTININISNLDQDIQKKLIELEEAIARKDSSAIKKAFGYIADKSVDVAIAIITGSLLR